MDDAQSKNQPVIYISLGSICKWKQWSIDALFHGLKKLGAKVVWSIRDFKTPDDNDPDFWIRPWVPQIELLSHPALTAGCCHCGFGGTLEFIAAGKPVVAWPHFADQYGSAMVMVERKVGVYLATRPDESDLNPATAHTYKDPVFDSEKVFEIFKEVTTNPIYAHNMAKL